MSLGRFNPKSQLRQRDAISEYKVMLIQEAIQKSSFILQETNIASEIGWLGDMFPFGMAHFLVYVSFREGN